MLPTWRLVENGGARMLRWGLPAAHYRQAENGIRIRVGSGRTALSSNHKSEFYVKRSSLEDTRR